MPTDIDLGAGYCGDALFTRFPGQYRNPEMEGQERANFANFPGNHGPVYTDPDAPRKTMVLKEVPGIGQVVVPVEHTMAQIVNVEHRMAGMDAVYPSDHTMVGLGDDPNTAQGQMHWHNSLVNALDNTAHLTNVPQQLGIAFNAVVQQAVQTALDKAKKGQFASVAAAVQYIHDCIIAAALHFKPELRVVASKVADTASKSATAALKSVWKAPVGALRKRTGMGDWPGSMMGGGMNDWISDAWNVLTGKPQSWYTNLSNIQNQLNILMAGITSVGADTWNSFGSGVQGPAADGSSLGTVDDYDTINGILVADMKSIVLAGGNIPTDAQIAQVQTDISNYQAQLTYVQQQNATIAADIAAGQAQVQAVLPPPMQSPSAVGQAAFAAALNQRANAFLGFGSSLLTYVAVGAGILGGLYILSNLKTFGLA